MIAHSSLPMSLAAFLLVIGPLVFIHEMGHYLAGRLFGIGAETFSIGFGRELFGWTDRRGTRWKVGWLPLGGYVRFTGDMNPASQPDAAWLSLPSAERNRTFQAKKLWQRAIVVAAGPAVNLLAAVLILAGFAIAFGNASSKPVIGTVKAGSAAAAAGLRIGDRVTSIDGQRIRAFADMVAVIRPKPGRPVSVGIDRAGAALTLTATPSAEVVRDGTGRAHRVGLLGVGPQAVTVAQAPVVGVRRTGEIIGLMAGGVVSVVTGERPVKELGGPIMIAKVSGEQLALGWSPFVFLIALVSINLGFINLLPVPMLDGGHLFFYAIEAVRRRPLDARAQEWAFRGGLAALAMLMLVVTINDLGSFGLWRNIAGILDPG